MSFSSTSLSFRDFLTFFLNLVKSEYIVSIYFFCYKMETNTFFVIETYSIIDFKLSGMDVINSVIFISSITIFQSPSQKI